MSSEKENSVSSGSGGSFKCACFLPASMAFYIVTACILALHVLFNIRTQMIGVSAGAVSQQMLHGILSCFSGGALAYNIIVVVTMVVAASGGYLLCRKVSSAGLESLLGGLIFGFSPFFQTEVSNGMVIKMAGLALLPYFLMALLNLNRTLSAWWAAVAVITCWVAAMFWPYCVVQFLVLLLVLLLAGWRNAEAGSRRGLLLRYLFVAVAIVLPWLLVPAVCAVHLPGNPEISAKYVSVFRMVSYPGEGEWGRIFSEHTRLAPLNMYMGKLVALFVMLAYFMAGRQHRLWKLGLALFLVLSLGTYFNRDFVAVTMLFAAVMTVLALNRLSETMFSSARARILLAVVVGWLILADFAVSDPRNNGLMLPTVAVPSSFRVIN